MHYSSLKNGKLFFETYADSVSLISGNPKILDIGAQDVNGSLKSVTPKNFEYIGVDFVDGKGVDIILEDPYKLPFESNSFDIVTSSSCYEHSEMFWLVHLEIMRILNPNGLFYLSVPSNGMFHRYPVDCWRFYPDSGNALVTWANRNGMNTVLLESYTSRQANDPWSDFVAIFLKDVKYANNFPKRIFDKNNQITNGYVKNEKDFINYSNKTEDGLNITLFHKIRRQLRR